MEYFKASVLFGFWTSSILFLIYTILHKFEKEEFLKVWAIGLALRAATYILDYNILNIHTDELQIVLIMRQIFFVLSIYLDIKGMYLFMRKSMNKVTFLALALIIIPNIFIVTKSFSYLGNTLVSLITFFFLTVYIVVCEFSEFKFNLFYIPIQVSMIVTSIFEIILLLSKYTNIHESTILVIYTCNQLIFYLSVILVKFEEYKLELIDAKNELCEKDKKLKTIINNQGDIIFELDNRGRFYSVSETINDIFQYSPEEIIGKNINEFINFDIDSTMVKSNILGQREIKAKTKDGKHIYINISWKMIRDENDTFMGVIGTIKDITAEKQLEEVIENDKLRTEFLTNISHDIKNPLNIINGTIQLMDLQANMKKEHYIIKHTQIIRKNVFTLLKLINNFIVVSKIESGYVDIRREVCNIVEIVEDTVLGARDYVTSKEICLEFDTEEEEIITAVDIDKIERVILNLLSNAVKFTPKDGSISFYMKKENNNVIIRVKDTGRGIPEDKIDKIFTRYCQIQDSDEVFHKGSGIGLSIVKSFVELHEGKVSVESVVGVGTEFILSLPIVEISNQDSILRESIGEKINIELSDL